MPFTPEICHPLQPVVTDDRGVIRFKPNKIVNFLLDLAKEHGVGMNELACMAFSDEDREQLAQLMGYSVGGFEDLSYVSKATLAKLAVRQVSQPEEDKDAQIASLQAELSALRAALREPVAKLFKVDVAVLSN